jgi:hypothetical protein
MLRTPSAKAAPPSTPALFLLLKDAPHSVLLLLLALSQIHLSSVAGDERGAVGGGDEGGEDVPHLSWSLAPGPLPLCRFEPAYALCAGVEMRTRCTAKHR